MSTVIQPSYSFANSIEVSSNGKERPIAHPSNYPMRPIAFHLQPLIYWFVVCILMLNSVYEASF